MVAGLLVVVIVVVVECVDSNIVSKSYKSIANKLFSTNVKQFSVIWNLSEGNS